MAAALIAAEEFRAIPDIVYSYRIGYKKVDWKSGDCIRFRDALKGIGMLASQAAQADLPGLMECAESELAAHLNRVVKPDEGMLATCADELAAVRETIARFCIEQGFVRLRKLIDGIDGSLVVVDSRGDNVSRRHAMVCRLIDEEKEILSKCLKYASPAMVPVVRALIISLIEVRSMLREVESLKRSEAYRVGMFVTWPVRKLCGGVKCLHDNGFLYTVKHAVGKSVRFLGKIVR